MINQSKIDQETQARVAATIERLIGNIPKVRRIINEQGYASLSTQLGRDWANLAYWQANGRLVFEEGEKTDTTTEPCPVCRNPDATCRHGLQDESGPVHLWNCPECGESCAMVCYDCPDCEKVHLC